MLEYINEGEGMGTAPYTATCDYNFMKLNRFYSDEESVICYHVNGLILDSYLEYLHILGGSVYALRIEAHINALACVPMCHRLVAKSVKNTFAGLLFNDAFHDERKFCVDVLSYIRAKCKYPVIEGVPETETFAILPDEMDNWRLNGSVASAPANETLAWLLPEVHNEPVAGFNCTYVLANVAFTQLFSDDHPSKIDLDRFEDAGNIANKIRFQTATPATLRRLRAHAHTGIIDPRKIVAVFTGVGEEGTCSFFFVHSARVADQSTDKRAMRLIISTARAAHSVVYEAREHAFIEPADLTGFVAKDTVEFYETIKRDSENAVREPVRRFRVRRFQGGRNQHRVLTLLRFIEPLYIP